MTFKVKEIIQILGGDISTKNTKMPGTSFGLSTTMCDVGGRLREIEGSVCASCYATRLENIRPSVKKGWLNRTKAVREATRDPVMQDAWVRAFVQRLTMLGHEYHRWHDSGDLQSDRHMSMIISVAQKCPDIKFWLPTKEKAIAKRAIMVMNKCGGMPTNLTIRVSEAMVDKIPSSGKHITPMSAVITHTDTENWICPARSQGNACGLCRACWDSDVAIVCYPKH